MGGQKFPLFPLPSLLFGPGRTTIVFGTIYRQQGAAELRSAAGRIADYSAIPETYADAVTAMYAMGWLSGVDSAGTFGGNSPMSRAAACVALCSLLDNI